MAIWPLGSRDRNAMAAALAGLALSAMGDFVLMVKLYLANH